MTPMATPAAYVRPRAKRSSCDGVEPEPDGGERERVLDGHRRAGEDARGERRP